MAPHYTYLATDLLSGTVLGELPVNGVSLDCQLNQPGNMNSGLKLSDPRIGDDELIARTAPGRTAFWVYRENTIVWGGIILTRTYQSNGKSLSLTGQTFECYAFRRFPASVIGLNGVNVYNQGQCSIIDALWQQLQYVSFMNIGVLSANLPAVDIPVGLTVSGFDLSTSYGDYMNSLTQVSTGPDWTVAWTEDGNGFPLKQLITAAPIGNPVGATDLVVDYPGAILNYTYSESASSGSNQWWAVGDGSGNTTNQNFARDSNSLDSGYPLWEGTNSYSGVTSVSTISAHAQSDVKTFPMPFATHAGTFKGDAMPPFGSYGMGDYVQMNVTDPRFPGGKTFTVRVIGWTIQPPDEGSGTEQINPVFDEPSANLW
jgi:hypothetical protein